MRWPTALATSLVIFTGVTAVGATLAIRGQKTLRLERQAAAVALAKGNAEAIEQRLSTARAATHALAGIVTRDPTVPDFDTVAAEMVGLYPEIESVQLQPEGVVRDVYPLAGNERAIGYDVLHDPLHAAICEETIAARRPTLEGPVPLRQGGIGVIVRMPVFLRGGAGEERFWGFTATVLRLEPLIRSAGLDGLERQGFAWSLSRAESEGTFAAGGGALADPVRVDVSVPNGEWTLALAPRLGWTTRGTLPVEVAGAALVAAIIAALAYRALRQPELLERLVRERTDALDRALRQREALLDGIPDPAWLKDRERRYIAVNEALARLAGVPAHAIVGRRHDEVFGASASVDTHDDEALARGEALISEEAVSGVDGVSRVYEVAKRSFRDARGGVVGTVGIARDVSERLGAARALRECEERFRASERHLRAVLDSVSSFVWVLTPEGTLVEANHAALDAVGVAREGVVGLPFAETPWWPDASSRARLTAAVEHGRRGEASRFDVATRLAGGRGVVLDFSLSPMLDPHGRVTHLVPSATEITERARAEARTRDAHVALTALVESSPLAVLQLDRQGVVTGWNAVAERMFGWTAAEAVGSFIPTVQDADRGEFLGTLDALFGRGVWLSGAPRRRLRKDGSLVDVHVSVAPLLDASGGVREAVVYYVDMTEYRRLEEALRQSQKMEAVGQLAGGVAHDFNNLLTIINMHLQLVEEVLAPGDAVREDLREVQAASARATALTRQLLAFSRRQVMQPKVLDLDDAVAEMLKMLHRLLGEHIDLRVRAGGKLWPVRADPGQLEQVVMNLAVNARDAMPDGGTLTITTRNVALDDIFVRSHEGAALGEHVVLEVSDEGCGMDEETRARAFEPFFTTKPRGKGTGLGLAMVYGIVTQSGGFVDCETAPGRGTTFRVYLPRSAEDVAPAAASGPSAAALRGTQRVLLAEDDDAVRAVTARALRSYGYTVVEARDGNDALAAVERGADFDVLVSDLVMPDVSGAELVSRIRASGRDPAVLLVSGYTEDEYIRGGALPAGASFMTKPFSAVALAEKLREVVRAHGLA